MALPGDASVARSALIDDSGEYRYVLERRWARAGFGVLWVMLNPSTADGARDDPTTRRCMAFSRRWGAASMTVVNLFALRSPTPSALVAHRDAVGPGNDAAVAAQRSRAGVELVVAAWGGHPLAIRRGAEMLERLRPLQCLGVTRGGAPRHPLYLPRETRVSPFEPRSLPRPEPSAAR